ncbi:UNVERIFIED_CONTAM: hypothetical protein Sindi_2265200, partial [Sesamum indicum]
KHKRHKCFKDSHKFQVQSVSPMQKSHAPKCEVNCPRKGREGGSFLQPACLANSQPEFTPNLPYALAHYN